MHQIKLTLTQTLDSVLGSAPSEHAVVLIVALAVAALVYYAGSWLWTRLRAGEGNQGRAHTPPADLPEKKVSMKERELGEWEPVKFEYPRVEPCKEHYSTVKPIPYRPFRWGEYHVTMGIRSMPWDEWIELDRDFEQVRRVCEHRIRTSGARLVQVLDEQPGVAPSGHAAAKELMYELAEYLSRRYPDVYSVNRYPVSEKDDENGWYGEGRIKDITIIPCQTTYDLDKDEPMVVSRMLIQEDFTIMIEGTDGRYYLQAGAVCIAGFWRLEDKMGMPLEEIHTSGNVPKYKTKLQMSMDRYFRRLPLDKPIVRNNYGFQIVQVPEARVPQPAPGSLLDVDPDELAWGVTMNGDEQTSEYVRVKHISDATTAEAQDAEDTDGAKDQEELAKGMRTGIRTEVAATPATLRLRTERQTLRRLPRTGAIVFTIRVYQTKIEDLAREPGVPGRLASAIRSWPEDVARYKARGAYESILPFLDQCHREQVEQGVASEEAKKSDYPF